MRILILTQWFQPEATFKGLTLAKALQARGHTVEVLTGFPNYPGGKVYPGYRIRPVQREVMEGVPVTRGALYPSHGRSAVGRILNYCSFALSTTILAFTLKRPDVVYVYTPPMTAAAGAVALRLLRRVPFVTDVQDLWPDTLTATGMVRDGPMLRMIGMWTNFVFRRATRIMVLSPGFQTRLAERDIRVPVTVIPNWAPDAIVAQGAALPLRADPEGFNVVFAGNIGRAQALETLVAAARILHDRAPDVRFTLIGGGIDRDALRAAAEGLRNVVFLPLRDPASMGEIFADADALLVHLRDDPLFSVTIPSKTQAYLAVGRPILMGVRGDAMAMVEEAGAGIGFTPEDPEAMAEAVLRMRALPPGERAAMGRAGRAYYQDRLSFERGVGAIERLLVEAATDRASTR